MSNNKLNMPNSHSSINNLDILNTLAVSKYLKKNQDAMISHKDMEDRLATKSDIADIKYDFQILKTDIAELKVSTIKWQIGIMLVLSSLFISLIKF